MKYFLVRAGIATVLACSSFAGSAWAVAARSGALLNDPG